VGELFPETQSAFALGIFNSGSILGSVIAPPVVAFVTIHFGWRAAFLLPSLAGLAWLPAWLAACPSGFIPRASAVPAAADDISLKYLLRPRQAWGVILMRAFIGPLTTFYWFWLPLYLVRGRGMTLASMAGTASLAYLLGGVGQAGGGYFSGWLVRRDHGVDAARKFTCTLGGVIATAGTLLVPMAGGVGLAGIAAGMGILGANVMSNMQIAIITDVFPPSVQARVTSMTGFGEGLVNMAMSLSTGFLVDHFSFRPAFTCAAVLPAAALAGLFFLVRECRRLSPAEIAVEIS